MFSSSSALTLPTSMAHILLFFIFRLLPNINLPAKMRINLENWRFFLHSFLILFVNTFLSYWTLVVLYLSKWCRFRFPFVFRILFFLLYLLYFSLNLSFFTYFSSKKIFFFSFFLLLTAKMKRKANWIRAV